MSSIYPVLILSKGWLFFVSLSFHWQHKYCTSHNSQYICATKCVQMSRKCQLNFTPAGIVDKPTPIFVSPAEFYYWAQSDNPVLETNLICRNADTKIQITSWGIHLDPCANRSSLIWIPSIEQLLCFPAKFLVAEIAELYTGKGQEKRQNRDNSVI